MNMTSPLSLPLVMAADVCQDVSPMGHPQLEEIRLVSSETRKAKIKWLINQR